MQANWLIGQRIVEAEQGGKARADYSRRLLETLSAVGKEYGSGFSVTSLKYMRMFYPGYPELLAIRHVMRDESAQDSTEAMGHALRDLSKRSSEADWRPGLLHSGLSWTHYRTLLKEERREARHFYEIEAVRNGWSARQLERKSRLGNWSANQYVPV